MDLAGKIHRVLAADPDGNALEFAGRWHSWRDLARFSRQLDALLAGRKIGTAARVGLIARNRPGHVFAFASLLATGRCTVMIYSAQSPEAIARDIGDLRLQAVIGDAQDWTPATLDAARSSGTLAIALARHDRQPNATIAQAGGPAPEPRRNDDPAVAMELLSSGTTGAPKRVPVHKHTFASAVEDAVATYAAGVTAEAAHRPNVVFHPLGNIAGVTFLVPLLFGGQPVALLERFELGAWLDAVGRHRPARVSLPPTVLRMLMDGHVPKHMLAGLASIGVGAAALDPELQAEFEQTYGIALLAGYGATEFCGVVANWTLELHRRFGACKRGSAGVPRPGVSLRVVDPGTGRVLGTGEVGVLEARVLRIGERWIRTTDLARLDQEGFLYLHGRADGAINRGGFKVLPEQIAHLLRQHPGVADAAVIGIADPRLGQVPVAVVEARAGSVLAADEIEVFARARLVAYQMPVRFLVVRALPRNPSLKVSLPALRRLVETHTAGIAGIHDAVHPDPASRTGEQP